MAPRASWKGHLRIALITIPVRLYNATSSSGRVRLNMLHKDCNKRVRQQYVCPEHGALQREDIVKGYEYEKDSYVVIDSEVLDSIKLETDKDIEVETFVDGAEVGGIYLNVPYYLAPDAPVAEGAFRVLRDALDDLGKLAVGRVVMSGREQGLIIAPRGKGMLLTTLRFADEVRDEQAYFQDLRDEPVNEEHLALTKQLIESKSADFDPTRFHDRYEEALVEVIKAKVEGRETVVVQENEVGKVADFMEALRRSVEAEGAGTTKGSGPADAKGKRAGRKTAASGRGASAKAKTG